MTIQSEMTSGTRASVVAWARLGGFIILIVTMVPVFLVLRAAGSSKTEKMPLLFHGLLSRLIGFKIRVHGVQKDRTKGQPVFFVSNHSSYLDIPALGSVINGCFVAKSEVAGWPVIGSLAKLQNTVFIERRAVRASTQSTVLRNCLEEGKSLILFPEGTSSDGMRTLPFKSSLFSIVEKPLLSGQHVTVQPVTILCTEIGNMPIGRSWRPYYAWYGDMTLVKHVWDVFKIGSFTVDVIFHPAVTMEDFGSRKLMSEYCHRTISKGVDQCVTGRFGT
ncbi:MAG TPA: 1-acyl-sn-glycerol-3-phosphate acyltransferase [Rhodospirillaceae bacterium]|nr:1-acyl-sn-glycerol-3-phosphate acyltransferase [Rhodospirillaceae bacterium]